MESPNSKTSPTVNPLWILICANLLIVGGLFFAFGSSNASKQENVILLNSRQFSSATSGTPQVAGESISNELTEIDKCKASIVNGEAQINCPTPTQSTGVKVNDSTQVDQVVEEVSDSIWAQILTWTGFVVRE